jgi:type II secretory pathway component PulK
MSKLLLNLRDVPDDEADDVRRLLDARGIGYYETRPSFWGISAGGIWVRDEADVAEAKRRMAEYQRERQARAREAHAAAERSGTAPTFVDVLRTQPLRVALTVIAIALVLALMAAPAMVLWR